MNFKHVEQIADAVLYEGYMLYPYRASSLKNRQRFNFGVLFPQTWCALQSGSDSQDAQMECLLKVVLATRLTIRVRFLQIVQRRIQRCNGSNPGEYVESIEVGDRVWQGCEEAVERTFAFEGMELALLESGRIVEFKVPASETEEPIRDAAGLQAGKIVRCWQEIVGALHINAKHCLDDLIKLKVRVENRTGFQLDSRHPPARESALLHSLVSAHLILGADGGEFVSLLETPANIEDMARSCENKGLWPVLAGDGPWMVLASPIILYDYPQVAAESAGNLFDGTEIDEILSLRILTLTEQEKAELRRSEDRVRQLLERTETIPNEQFMKMHGVLRGVSGSPEDPQ